MKKFFCVLGFCIASTVANASYLYWQVLPTDYNGTSWDSARLVFASGATDNYSSGVDMSNVGYIDADGKYSANSYGVSVSPTYDFAYVADVGSLASGSSYSYWVELYNGDTKVALSQIGHLNNYSGTEAAPLYASAASLTTQLSDIANVGIWHATSYGPVPEPTSAMLMLFGAAFLGLKRKNRRIA